MRKNRMPTINNRAVKSEVFTLNIRLTKQEKDRLFKYGRMSEMSMSDIFRTAIKVFLAPKLEN